jgi:hypothetical protein
LIRFADFGCWVIRETRVAGSEKMIVLDVVDEDDVEMNREEVVVIYTFLVDRYLCEKLLLKSLSRSAACNQLDVS